MLSKNVVTCQEASVLGLGLGGKPPVRQGHLQRLDIEHHRQGKEWQNDGRVFVQTTGGGSAGSKIRRPKSKAQGHWIAESFDYKDENSDHHSLDPPPPLCARYWAKHSSLSSRSHTVRLTPISHASQGEIEAQVISSIKGRSSRGKAQRQKGPAMWLQAESGGPRRAYLPVSLERV